MPGLLATFKITEPWENDVPADLVPVVKHLRTSFEDTHWGCGQTTLRFCFAILHHTDVEDPQNEHLNYLTHMRGWVGPSRNQQFGKLLKEGTLPSTFKAFWDLYLDCLTVEAIRILRELIEVGLANQERLSKPCVEWAEAQVKHVIRSKIHLIPMWVRGVCDKQPYDPQEDMEEGVFWRKWQAPNFLIMVPSKYRPYDPAAVWERNDSDVSSGWLETFSVDYVIHIENQVRTAAGEASLELAKKPRPKEDRMGQSNQPVNTEPSSSGSDGKRPRSAKREVRMSETQSRYKGWQKEYRELKKRKPGMSDVWYAKRISESAVGEGNSRDTIRKHMRG